MIKKTIEGIQVMLFVNANEYVEQFFDIPEGGMLDEESLPESTGFCTIDENAIFVYKRKDCSFEDLLSTVAHELGHLIKGGFKKNPPQTPRYDSKHELKANHYETFTLKAYKITTEIFKMD